MRTIIRIVFLLLIAVSCLEEPDCINLRNNIVGITFKTIVDNKAIAENQAFDLVTAEGASETLYAGVTASKLLLPLNYLEDTTRYTLQIQDTAYQLVLTYSSQTEFISEPCGERFILGSLDIAMHDFDSVSVLGKTPGIDNNANNIEIYR
jgi:hypothetical protein